MSSNGFHLDTRQIQVNVKELSRNIELGIAAAIDFQATQSEFFMRNNAPWTDRTGNARSGLFTATKREGKRFFILLSHTASYGIWLEVRFSGRYEIIVPTLHYTIDVAAEASPAHSYEEEVAMSRAVIFNALDSDSELQDMWPGGIPAWGSNATDSPDRKKPFIVISFRGRTKVFGNTGAEEVAIWAHMAKDIARSYMTTDAILNRSRRY